MKGANEMVKGKGGMAVGFHAMVAGMEYKLGCNKLPEDGKGRYSEFQKPENITFEIEITWFNVPARRFNHGTIGSKRPGDLVKDGSLKNYLGLYLIKVGYHKFGPRG
jgi:hypothetical protein